MTSEHYQSGNNYLAVLLKKKKKALKLQKEYVHKCVQNDLKIKAARNYVKVSYLKLLIMYM